MTVLNQQQKRNQTVDLLKALAIVCVVMVHICSIGFYQPIGSADWLTTILWGSLARACVPIFFMCSGVLFLSPTKELSLKKLYLTYILRIVIAMYLWAFLYEVYALIPCQQLTPQHLFEALKQVLLFKQEFHFYYLHIILLFYACLPVVRVFVRHASKRDMEYALLLWALVGILYPTIKGFWPISLLIGIPTQWLLNMTYASIGYGLLGYYLHTYGVSQKISRVSALSGVAFMVVGTSWMSWCQGTVYLGFLEGMTVGPALLAMGFWGLCSHWSQSLSNAMAQVSCYLSKASFCIYIVHIFFIYELSDLGIDMNCLPAILSIPLLTVVTLLLSTLVYTALSKVPLVNRWLI